MQVKVGDRYARCPYCGGAEFIEDQASAAAPLELACAGCGGFASRKLIVETAADPGQGVNEGSKEGGNRAAETRTIGKTTGT